MERERKAKDEAAMPELDEKKWVCDSSVDYKGRVPVRASTGVWKASLFIISIEFAERLSYFGLTTSLILYLSKVIHMDLETAAKQVNYWSGVTTFMPLIGGFVADAYLSRYFTVLASSVIYVMGLLLLTASRYIPSLEPCADGTNSCNECRKTHEIVFFIAMYMISVGTGGHKPALESFGADQFDENHPVERRQKMSYFNWWNFGLCAGLVLGVTVLIYVQDNAGWGASSIILAAVMAITIVIFVSGRKCYRYRAPSGSPLTPMFQVVVAAFRKRKIALPPSFTELYEVQGQSRLLCSTSKLRFFDKAAIIMHPDETKQQSGWRLSTVTKVEELKLLINLTPIWLATLPFGVCVAQSTTFFIKQGVTMDRYITTTFQLPSVSIYAVAALGMIVSVTLYDKILVPVLRKNTGNERGITILKRIGFGMIFSIASMVAAALVEKKRLNIVAKNPVHGSLSMSVFWLAPQFFVLGFGDGFTLVGLQEYFYDQVPDSMRSLGIAFYLSVFGAGNFLSAFIITLINKASEKGGGRAWIGKDLNHSRLDKFYWVLAGMNALNLVVFVFLARRYSYKNVQREVQQVTDDHLLQGDEMKSMA
ncbi:unnamed protein product [Rhodiola kirilowii]